MFCIAGGLVACGSGDDSGESSGAAGGDLNSRIVEILTSERGGSLPDEQAGCIARHVIADGVNQEDMDKAEASDEGLSVTSKILDAFNDATMICVPGVSQSSPPAGF